MLDYYYYYFVYCLLSLDFKFSKSSLSPVSTHVLFAQFRAYCRLPWGQVRVLAEEQINDKYTIYSFLFIYEANIY